MPAHCLTCSLPADIQENIYVFLIQKGLNRLETHKEIVKICADRGLTPPLQSAFYEHCKNHLSPEQSALARIAKNEDQITEHTRGFRSLILTYLNKKYEEETEDRRSLRKLVEIIKAQIEGGKLDPRDLAALGRSLTYAVTALRETNLTDLVFDELILDLLSGFSFSIQQLVARTLVEIRQRLQLKLPDHAEELDSELMQSLNRIVSGADEIQRVISAEPRPIRRYQGPGAK